MRYKRWKDQGTVTTIPGANRAAGGGRLGWGTGSGLVVGTHGSGECMGVEAWRMYWVHWNTRNARLARKSRAASSPTAGRSWKPVFSARRPGENESR